jgi:hypothetical protein
MAVVKLKNIFYSASKKRDNRRETLSQAGKSSPEQGISQLAQSCV